MGQSERPTGPEPRDSAPQPQNINRPPASEHELPFHVALLSIPSPEHAQVTAATGKDANEDFSVIDLPTRTVLVEDGVGGKGKGRGYLASRLAAEVIMGTLGEIDKKHPSQDLGEIEMRLRHAIQEAHKRVREEKARVDAAIDPQKEKPSEFAATVSLTREVVLPDGSKHLVWANVGDSSIRVFRDGKLLKISTAHSAHWQAMKLGEIPESLFSIIEENLETVERPGEFVMGKDPDKPFNPYDPYEEWRAEMFMYFFERRNQIASAVGFDIEELPIESGEFELREGDVVVSYSDGIDDILLKQEIETAIARTNGHVDSVPESIIAAVKKKSVDPKNIWDGNRVGHNGRAKKPDDMTVAAWKA